MKKRVILSLLVLCLLIFPLSACDNSSDKNEGLTGTTTARVVGLIMDLYNQENRHIKSFYMNKENEITLSVNERYIIEANYSLTGGSTPIVLRDSGATWEYDSEIISLEKYTETYPRPKYYLEFKKPTEGTILRVNEYTGYTVSLKIIVTE